MTLLTKSLFTTSLGCPRKLYYAVNKQQYDNANSDNDFLQSLADGGVQVGALARRYYFAHYSKFDHLYIKTKDKDEALRQTAEAMKKRNIVIAEAAFEWNGCLVRVDILVKRDRAIDLIEVKSSSMQPTEDEEKIITLPKNKVNSAYRGYIYDTAFQKYVVEQSLGVDVTSYLMLINKSRPCDVDGLNQMIRINTKTHEVDESGLEAYTPSPNTQDWLLYPCDITFVCDSIIAGDTEEQKEFMGQEFKTYVEELLVSLRTNMPLDAKISSQCKGCEFKCGDPERSGYHRCWRECAGFSDADFERPHVLELWAGKGFRKMGDLIANKRYFMDQLATSDYFTKGSKPFSEDDTEFCGDTRRQIQVETMRSGAKDFVLLNGIKSEMSSWKYPLHFIDFETCTVAVPFSKDRYPYETVAFQYSHHQLNEDNTLTHTEWISTERCFPNFEFVRNLKRDLSNDEGTIFRYSHHENSVLNQIAEQLKFSEEPDREELIAFIETITSSSKCVGKRNMVDLCEVVVDYYYDPSMGGSNSIKVVLPAVLQSPKLQAEFMGPYSNYVDSDNYKLFDFSLINYTDKGTVGNPYKYLPVVGAEMGETCDDDKQSQEIINNGGLANANYARLQYDGLSEREKLKLRNALLRYCELDTMAMVLIYRFFELHAK